MLTRRPLRVMSACFGRCQPEQALGHRSPTGADQAGNAENLARGKSEADIAEILATAEPIDGKQHRRVLRRRRFGLPGGSEVATRHGEGDLRLAEAGQRFVKRLRAVAQDDHPLADLGDFLKLMADEDEAHAGRQQAADDREEIFHFAMSQRGRRFVHDQQPRLVGERSCDCDELLLRNRQVTDRTPQVDSYADFLDDAPRFGHAPGAMGQPLAAMKLVRQPNVLCCREIGEQRKVLVDDLHSGFDPLDRRAVCPVGSIDKDAAGVRAFDAGDDLDQRRLAGPVLADESERLAPTDIKADGGKGVDAVVRLGNAVDTQERHGALSQCRRCCGFRQCVHRLSCYLGRSPASRLLGR